MKHSNILAVFLLFVLVTAGILWDHHTHPVQADQKSVLLPEKEIHIPATASPPAAPELRAKYACVMDSSSGRILYGKESGTKAPMASTTKIMTAILVLESGRVNETVTASSHAASMPKVHLGMRKGYQYRLKDLLYSLMLESHNDSAVAIAEHIAGSVQGFADKMNQKAAALGMKDTHFVTPNGLDADGHYSTAANMCRLAAYAIQNREFCALVQTKNHSFSTLDGKHRYSVSNKDAFLSFYDGALGIKTGFTGKAGYCFVGAARRSNTILTSCVLACGWPPNKSLKWTDTKKLMDFGFTNYTPLTMPVQDLTALQIPVEDGRSSYVSCQQPDEVRTLSSRSESISVIYDIPEKLYAPVHSDTSVGSISYYIGEKLYYKQPVFPAESIEKSVFSDTIGNVLHLWMENFA